MGSIRVAIDINASTQRVWEVVEPIERHVDWMADAVAIRFKTDQTRGTGTQFYCDTKVGPINLVDEMTITSWVPEKAMGVTHTGVVTGTGEFTLEPSAQLQHDSCGLKSWCSHGGSVENLELLLVVRL